VDATKITAIVSIILALSIASERLVEIIKGLIPWLDKQNPDPRGEGIRRTCLHILAVISGVLTVYLAKDYIPEDVARPTGSWAILGLGLLASGGSSLWNSVLSYLTNVKDIKKLEVATARKTAG
jgi:hypothetical protein